LAILSPAVLGGGEEAAGSALVLNALVLKTSPSCDETEAKGDAGMAVLSTSPLA